ncbi:hypothetical protein KQX54_003728 [Cotesia glomerata]|uniref:Uncharacterized protein n=1 Tax=Cotesia glomerata TaxID=32391 RepID=A0AAV7J578_COTGL|nr:hypothetical protein KQX54_003728 [Cotesia glomerata]
MYRIEIKMEGIFLRDILIRGIRLLSSQGSHTRMDGISIERCRAQITRFSLTSVKPIERTNLAQVRHQPEEYDDDGSGGVTLRKFILVMLNPSV